MTTQKPVNIFGIEKWNLLASILLLYLSITYQNSLQEICVQFWSEKWCLSYPFTDLKLLWIGREQKTEHLKKVHLYRKYYRNIQTNMHVSTMHRQTQTTHTNAHARSPMLIFIPRALILLCMSASSGTPTENPSMCASVCVRSWRWENNVAPEGSHLSPFSPSSLIPPLDSVPAGISLFSSGEMSDLFHHPSHRGWTLPSVHPTSVKLQNQSHFCISRPSGA